MTDEKIPDSYADDYEQSQRLLSLLEQECPGDSYGRRPCQHCARCQAAREIRLLWGRVFSAHEDMLHYQQVANFWTLKATELESTMEVIATPKRPDGTYNYSREACEQLAKQALGRGGK